MPSIHLLLVGSKNDLFAKEFQESCNVGLKASGMLIGARRTQQTIILYRLCRTLNFADILAHEFSEYHAISF